MLEKTSIKSMLLKYANNVYKKDNNYDIANALIKYYNDIPKLTIHDMADRCYVSTASLSRFIHLLGFEDYPSFKMACKNSVDIRVDYSVELSRAIPEDIKPICERYTNHIKQNMDYVMDSLDYNQLNRICKDIFESEYVAFFGLEFATLLGSHFQVKMAELNKLIKIGNTLIREKEIAKSLDDKCIAIIASLEGGYFYYNNEIIDTLKQNNVKIIALTMNNTSMIKNIADEIIISSLYNSETEGRVSLLYVIELLLMIYVINYKDQII